MEATTKINGSPFLPPSSSSLRRQFPATTQPSFIKLVPSSSTPLKIKPLSIKTSSIRSASLSNPSSYSVYNSLLPILKNPKSKSKLKTTLIPPLPIPILRTTFITAITAVTVFFAGHSRHKLLAAPPPQAASTLSEEELESLGNEMDYKIRNGIFPSEPESVELLNQLLQIEPEKRKWRFLKGHVLAYQGYMDSARSIFTKIIKQSPLLYDAYCALIEYTSPSESEWEDIKDMIEDAINSEAMKFSDTEVLITFTLLYALYHERAGNYKESFRIYDELLTKYPEDYRVYCFKGALHTFLKEKEEGDECFKKYTSLVPNDDPYKLKFDNYMHKIKAYVAKMH